MAGSYTQYRAQHPQAAIEYAFGWDEERQKFYVWVYNLLEEVGDTNPVVCLTRDLDVLVEEARKHGLVIYEKTKSKLLSDKEA